MTADTDQPTLAVLKLCPFCGGEARIREDVFAGSSESYVNSLYVQCTTCSARSKMVDAWPEDATQNTITAWNTRTHSEPRPIAGLREAAQRVVDDYPAAAGACASIEGGDGKPGWGSIRRLAEALAAHSPAPMTGEVDLHDVVTHRSAWRDAIILARDEASEGSEDPEADRCYWNHELRAFDRIFAKLAALATPTSTQGV